MLDFNDINRTIQQILGHDPDSNKRMFNAIRTVVVYLNKVLDEIKENGKPSQETLIEVVVCIGAISALEEMEYFKKDIDGFLDYFKNRIRSNVNEDVDKKNAQRLAVYLATFRGFEAYLNVIFVK